MAGSESIRSESKPLLNRHYSTIGIEDVFLEAPPVTLLPRSYLTASEPCDVPFETWEIVGRIKSCPEDFVVREMASRKRTPKLPEDFDVVANLWPSAAAGESGADENTAKEPVEQSLPPCKAVKETLEHTNHAKLAALSTKVSDEPSVPSSPAEIVEQILSDAFGNEKKSELLDQLRLLDQRAVACILDYTGMVSVNESNATVWIPPMASPADSSLSQDDGDKKSHRGGNRGVLHRNLRLAFPLLKSETIMHESVTQPPQPSGDGDAGTPSGEHAACTEKHPWIQVSVDDTFFGLAPSLYKPESDIPQLYSFRNRGCIIPVNRKGCSENVCGKKRKRHQEIDDDSVAILRLRPDLAREERRPVHHLISNTCRDFETSTIPNYNAAEESNESLAAVVVKWSKRAQQRARKKTGGSNECPKAAGSTSNTLFVLKKTKKEHLTVIQRLAHALRCRQSDIGLAGIKDMHAVTYQFCTVSNMSPQSVERAKSSLSSQGIDLGRIHQVDWVLNQGDLLGNRFEIVVRNVERIQVRSTKDEQSEVRVPCERDHVCAMVNRVRKYGFVNFYGEQRLGMPGRSSEVGVRAFDIGRALLQQDFSKAIDLLMTGRLVCRGGKEVEDPEIRNARQVWRDSNGDAKQTLKAVPTKGDAMARERIVLQGLKRYGNEDPLAALKCLHFAVRTFWINAYQSFVWNAMASERLRRFGTNVVKGDLYRLPDEEGRSGVGVVAADTSSIDIADVVLPLPGYAVQYPENAIGSLYRDFMKKENVCFDRNAPSEATSKGSYRSLVAFAQNLEVSFGEASDTVSAFTLKFDLPSGSYATMLMRELMLTTIAR